MAVLNHAEEIPLVLLEQGSVQVGSYDAILVLDRGEGLGGVVVHSSLWKGPRIDAPNVEYDSPLRFEASESAMSAIRRLVASGAVVGYTDNRGLSSTATFVTLWDNWLGQEHFTVAGYCLDTTYGYLLEEDVEEYNHPDARPLAELVSRMMTLVAREREKLGLVPF